MAQNSQFSSTFEAAPGWLTGQAAQGERHRDGSSSADWVPWWEKMDVSNTRAGLERPRRCRAWEGARGFLGGRGIEWVCLRARDLELISRDVGIPALPLSQTANLALGRTLCFSTVQFNVLLK